ncbi:MAG: serine/threonine protein kinase [Myxococcales bacterium]|nr:serine/threonine protein kinase [Myxococcales bacterium]
MGSSRDRPAEGSGSTSGSTNEESTVASRGPGPEPRLDEPWGTRAADELRPPMLGRYLVLGTLGQGAMGTVLEAFDRTLDRRVAIKVLRHDLSERRRARLMREAQALAKLSHPNVVQVYEAGDADGRAFVAMELVQGQSLREWMDRQPRPSWRECVEVYLQAGEGLAAAHAEGLVHRDFKPSNAVLDERGRARVLDFGLARHAEDGPASRLVTADPEAEAATPDSELTKAGSVLGTPAYMPLEQMQGEEVDPRSDQFGFCVALYEAVYGERPFAGKSMAALMVAIVAGKVRPPPKGSTVPQALRKILLRGLAAKPDDRWPSMDELLARLRALVAPRRRAWLALGVFGGLGLVGLGIAYQAEVGERCEGARARLDGVWDDARRTAVRDAILGLGLSYGPGTWERIEPRLDDYAAAWVAMHTETCEATNLRREQSPEVMDLRMACLHRRRVALREAVEVLMEADATRVAKAVDLVAGLPGLARCEDVHALRTALPPPEDPEVAAQVQDQRDALQRAAMLRWTNDADEAFAVADAVRQRAEALGHAPLVAEALFHRGKARVGQGEYPEAEQDLERAQALAAELGYDTLEADAEIELTRVVGYLQARPEPGLWWGRIALARSRGPEIEPVVEAMALATIGDVLGTEGRLEDALDHHRRSLAISEQVLGPHDPGVAHSLYVIGSLLQRQGKLDEALALHRRALAIFEDAFGPDHPQVAIPLLNLGKVLREQGELDEALALHRRALAIWEAALGPTHHDLGIPLHELANVLLDEGELDEALALHRRALAIWEATLGPTHINVAYGLDATGRVLRAQGELDEARAHHQRALTLEHDALGADHPNLAYPLLGLAEVALAQGDPETARVHAERALALREAGEVSPVELAEARFTLARAQWPAPALRPRARVLAQQARDAYAEIEGGHEDELAAVEAWRLEHVLE